MYSCKLNDVCYSMILLYAECSTSLLDHACISVVIHSNRSHHICSHFNVKEVFVLCNYKEAYLRCKTSHINSIEAIIC